MMRMTMAMKQSIIININNEPNNTVIYVVVAIMIMLEIIKNTQFAVIIPLINKNAVDNNQINCTNVDNIINNNTQSNCSY